MSRRSRPREALKLAALVLVSLAGDAAILAALLLL